MRIKSVDKNITDNNWSSTLNRYRKMTPYTIKKEEKL